MRSKDEIVEGVLNALLEDDAIEDFAYDHFRQSEAVDPPFAIYRRVAPQNFYADGAVYYRGDNVDLELYAESPEEMASLMAATEELLDAEEVYYNIAADTVYIENEDFYETLYEL